MSSFQSKIRSRRTIESPRKYDVPKIPILFDHTPLEEMPFKEPEIRFGNSNIERLPTKYKDVLRNIVRAIAIEGGWSTARINKDIHNTTTRGTHHRSDHRLPSNAARSGPGIQITPDDPHLTVAVESEEFPSLNRTIHINTTVVPGDATLREPQNRTEMFDTRKYPFGFPFDQLRPKGLSEYSARLQPPKQEYARIYNIWRRKQQKLARKEAMRDFDNVSSNFPKFPARGSTITTPERNGFGKDSSKRSGGSNNRFSILEFLSEQDNSDDVAGDTASASFIPSTTGISNNCNESAAQPETQSHAKPSFAHVARYTPRPTTPSNATVTTSPKSSSDKCISVVNTSSPDHNPKRPRPSTVPKTPVATTTNNPPTAPKPSPAKHKTPPSTRLRTRNTTNKRAPQPPKMEIDRQAATVTKYVHSVQGPWLQGPPMPRSESGRD